MEITIKTIRGIAVSNLIILGLAACSSSPAPWTQADDDPWGSKHATDANSVPSDEAVSDTSLNDPVLLADPEPEPIIMQEPESAMAPEVIVPIMVEELTPEQEIMAMPASNYAVQVYASKTAESVEKFKSSKGLENLMTVRTDRSGSIVYVLVDVHPDRSTANAAATQLEAATGSKPWVRSIAGLQKIVTQ
jgi:septal ring-binding cell division protein DamX